MESDTGGWGELARSLVSRAAELATADVAAEARAMGLTSVAARLESLSDEGLQVGVVQARGRVGGVEFDGSTWAHCFLTAYLALSKAGPLKRVVVVSGGRDDLSLAGELAAAAYSWFSGAALEAIGPPRGAERAPEDIELTVGSILALAEASRLDRSALRDTSLSELAERAEASDPDAGGAFRSLLREMSKALWGIYAGVPIFAHLHICRMRFELERISQAVELSSGRNWLEFELENCADRVRVHYLSTPRPWLAAMAAAAEAGARLMRELRDDAGWRPGVMHSSFIRSLLQLYSDRDMPLQWHLLFSESSSIISGRKNSAKWESSLARYLKFRRKLERTLGGIPPGAPLFRLWALSKASLSHILSKRMSPAEFGAEVEKWVQRVALAREEDCRQARLLAMLMRGDVTNEHVRHLLAHSGFVHFAILDVAPEGECERGCTSFLVYYDPRALDLIEDRLRKPLPSLSARGNRYYVST